MFDSWLKESTAKLVEAGVLTARLDCLVLAEDVLQKDRSRLLAHPEWPLTATQLSRLNTFIVQRSRHIPLAYIRGKVAFFGRDFTVNSTVLVPRPETEIIIELLIALHIDTPVIRLADVGTGSGCIGITAALEISHSTVDFYDIDGSALAMAKHNAATHNVRGRFYSSNVLSEFHGPYDVILTNLPYVPEKYPINTAASFEPRIALFSGDDGLNHYRLLWQQVGSLKNAQPGHILLEAFPEQHTALRALAQVHGYEQRASEGFIQHFARLA